MLNSQSHRYGELMRKYSNDNEFMELVSLLLLRYELKGTGDKMSWMIKQLNDTLRMNEVK